MPRRHFIVKGQVQGVGFRWFVQRAASGLNLTGWVRNMPSGTVEAEAEGDEASLRDFQDRLRAGPSAARVEAVDVKDMPEQGGDSGFRIEGW